MAAAKTAILRLETVKRENVEHAASAKETNANQWIVVNVEFAKKILVLTPVNFAQSALSAKMKNAKLQLNVALKTLAVPVKTALMEHVLLLTVEGVVLATMSPMSVKRMNLNASHTVECQMARHVLVTLERLALSVSLFVRKMTKPAAVWMMTVNVR